jgi:integrase
VLEGFFDGCGIYDLLMTMGILLYLPIKPYRASTYLGGRPSADELIFTLTDGSPWGPDYLSRCWHRATVSLGLPQVGLHALRHSHASALIAAGLDPLTISRRLGHGTPAFTLATYGHLFANTDAAAAIDAALGAKKR